MTEPIGHAAGLARRYLASLRSQSITGDLRAAELRAHLETRYAFEEPIPSEDVLDDLMSLLQRGGIQASHPAYFGLFNPSVSGTSVAAATLVATINPQLGAASHGRAAALLERHVLGHLAKAIGYSAEATGSHFTSGGQEANTEAVVTALTHAFPAIREGGLRSLASQPVFYLSSEAHHSFEKAAHVAGLGRGAVRRVPVDATFAMDMTALSGLIEADRAQGKSPFLVVGTAGSTTTGSIDPLEAIADLCQCENLWFHCDAAWGGTVLLSPRSKLALAGIERSDSVTWDAHKWLQMPLGAGMFFTSRPEALRATFSTDSPYMPPRRGQDDDLYDVSMQWSRRGAGLPLFTSLAELGREGVTTMVDRMLSLGDELRFLLRSNGFSIMNHTPLPVLCFTHPAIETGRTTAMAVAQVVDRAGRAWIAPVELTDGRQALRACISSHLTESSDLLVLLTAIREAIASLVT